MFVEVPLLFRVPRAVAFAACVAMITVATRGLADEAAAAAPSDAERKEASTLFGDGERAFAAGDFSQAARLFEQAYARAPHEAALWNAARSWHELGELTRAANLYAKYLATAPVSAPDRDAATAALDTLAKQLGRLEIVADPGAALTIDAQATSERSVYVFPGEHAIRSVFEGREVVRVERIAAGSVVSVALVAPSETIPPAPAPSAALPSPSPVANTDAPAQPSRGVAVLPPVVPIVLGVVSVGLGAVTAWSGVDTLAARDDYDHVPVTYFQQIGEDKQARTNLLLGVTAGVAALGLTTAIFFTDWSDHNSQVGATVGADGVWVRGVY